MAPTAGLLLVAATALLGAGSGEIESFVRVDEKVSTGARLAAGQIERLRSERTRAIVDLREPGEIDPSLSAAAEQAGIRYVSIPVRTAEPRDEQVDRFLEVLADPGMYPVFLTCGSGNRVGAFWMIRRMVVDLGLGVEIVGLPTVRVADGLALSSRNAYLSADERKRAVALPTALNSAAAVIRSGKPVGAALATAKQSLVDAGFLSIDYVALVDAATLEPLEAPGGAMRLIAAATIGGTRLIDNVAVEMDPSSRP